jgi:hypothetical protein
MMFEGIYRRFQALRVAKGPLDARFTFTESLAVAQVEAQGHEMTRAGRRFYLAYNGSVPTGIAPVQAFPTTAAQWVIWNNDNAKTYFFEQLGAMVFSGTTGLGGELLYTIFKAPAQTGAHATGLAVASASFSSISSKAIIKSGVTITDPATPVWAQVAEQVSAAAIIGPASCIASRPGYRSIVAVNPGYGLGLAVLAPAGTTPLYLPLAEWVEAESDME